MDKSISKAKKAIAVGVMLGFAAVPLKASHSDEPYDIKTRSNVMMLKDQVNHPWVEFSLDVNDKKRIYIALEEKIEYFKTAGVEIHIVTGPKTTRLLNEKEKEYLLSKPKVKEVVLEELEKMKNVITPSIPIRR